jgi:acetyltransferase
LRKFFYPKSICVIGASSKSKSIGYEILKSIVNYGFTGPVYPVNPKAGEILNYKCFKSVKDIEEVIDLAVVVVPPQIVFDSIEELIELKIDSVILITAGFGETGNKGKKLEQELVKKIRRKNIRMVGPNCMGIINTLDSIKLNATFVAEKPEKGGIGFLSQSGAIGAAVLNSLRETDIRLAHFISIGNKADISELDVLAFWLMDDKIKTITFYLESFENGLELIRLFKTKSLKKPMIVLKSGKTESGMKAAASHTGALGRNEKIIDALLDQFGIIRANTINEMFNTAKGFEHFPIPTGNNIAIITNAAGPAILAVDKLEERNLKLAEISEETKSILKTIVHPAGSTNNPIDLLPAGRAEVYRKVIEIIREDANIDAIISIFVEPVMVDAYEVIEEVNSIDSKIPIYQVCMPLPGFWKNYSSNSNYKNPIFKNPEDPPEVISNILHYESNKDKSYNFSNIGNNSIHAYEKGEFLSHEQVTEICKNYGIPLVDQQLFSKTSLLSCSDFKFPIALKGISNEVIHKTELDGVKLNLKDKTELIQAVEDLEIDFRKNNTQVENFLVQKYIEIKHELLIGGFRDKSFGPVIMFGSGGKYVEILNDIKIKSAYLTESDIDEMIDDTKIGKIIRGVRGEKGIDISRLKKIIQSIAKLMIENHEILELDLNPLVVSKDNKLLVVDIRIKVKNK